MLHLQPISIYELISRDRMGLLHQGHNTLFTSTSLVKKETSYEETKLAPSLQYIFLSLSVAETGTIASSGIPVPIDYRKYGH